MNTEELNSLIEKYYNGDTSEEEERALREYLKNDNIPESYQTDKALFGYYTAEGEIIKPSADFETRIMSGIDSADNTADPHRLRKYILPYISIAAGVLILAGTYFFLLTGRSEPKDTFKDPAIAYAETMKILTEISSQLNYGRQTLDPLAKINEVTVKSFDAINRSANKIDNNIRTILNLQNSNEDTVPTSKNK